MITHKIKYVCVGMFLKLEITLFGLIRSIFNALNFFMEYSWNTYIKKPSSADMKYKLVSFKNCIIKSCWYENLWHYTVLHIHPKPCCRVRPVHNNAEESFCKGTIHKVKKEWQGKMEVGLEKLDCEGRRLVELMQDGVWCWLSYSYVEPLGSATGWLVSYL